MKKLASALAFLLLATCGLFLLKEHKKPASPGLKIPGGANEENKEARLLLERMQLADPATGEIPKGIAFLEREFAAGLPQAVSDRSGPDWTARGPWNVGGRTRALAVDVTNENRILAGGVSGGIWLSEDGGQSWARKTPLDAHPGCVSIAQDTRPGHTDTWYYLSGEIMGASASGFGWYALYLGDGMFKSIDGGNTWTPIDATDNGNPNTLTHSWQTGWRLITDPANLAQDVVYAATIGAIYRSTDGGASWTVVLGNSNVSTHISFSSDVAISATGVLYATLGGSEPRGIYRSVDGTNWTNITPANFPATSIRTVMGINPNNPNEVYFLSATPGFGHFINYFGTDDWTSLWKYSYLSGDGSGAGGAWEDRSMNLPNTGTEFDGFAGQGGYDLVVGVQPGTNHVFIGGTSFYRSTDGFATPDNTAIVGGYKPGTAKFYPNHHPDLHALWFSPSKPNVLLTASDGGLHRTEDCNAANVSWTSLNRGYHTTQFYTAIIDKNAPGDPTIIGGTQDNGSLFVNSDNPLSIWKQTVGGDGAFGGIAPGKTFYVLSAQQGRVVKCSLDDQGNVLAFQRIDPLGPKQSNYLFINPLDLDPNDANILYLPAGNRFYRQDQLGSIPLNNGWNNISTGWTQFPDTLVALNDGGILHIFSAVAVSQSNPAHRVYLGTSRNKVYRIDNANTGTPALTPLPSPPGISTSGFVNCLAVDPDNGDRVILVYSNYNIYSIFLSADAGQSWQKVGGNLEFSVIGGGNAPSIRWISILPFPDGTRKYFCGTSVGLFSADSLKVHTTGQPGTQWALEAPGIIGSAVVPFVDTRASDGLVVVASHGNGMFTTNFSPPVSSHEPTNGPGVLVFPNPAGDFVGFKLPGISAASTTVRLFDQQGNLVRQTRFSGESVRLDLNDLSSGVYFWDLQGMHWRKSGKLVKT